MRVVLLLDAQRDFDALPVVIRDRVLSVFERLREWPSISGAKPLRKEWRGHHRIRVGDWRVLFRVQADVIIVRIKHRSEVYDE